jgi:hypothetical protein
MAAVSRIRDPQRLVELVADTMAREAARADRARGSSGGRGEQPPGAGKEETDDEKRGG